MERCDAGLSFWIVGSGLHENANASHALCLLRIRRERPHDRAAQQRDDFAPSHHSITSSARTSIDDGMSRPSVFAVLRLMMRSNLVGCTTGKSAGFAPLRIRPM